MFRGQIFRRLRWMLRGQALIDARFEELRRKKEEEWRAKGVPERLIRRALDYAEDYALGMASALGVDPALVYPKALEFADEWIEGIMKAMFE